MGYRHDPRLEAREALYIFQLQDTIYHLQGPLQGSVPSHAQLYFMDMESANASWLERYPFLRYYLVILRKLNQVLCQYNPFYKIFFQAFKILNQFPDESFLRLSPQVRPILNLLYSVVSNLYSFVQCLIVPRVAGIIYPLSPLNQVFLYPILVTSIVLAVIVISSFIYRRLQFARPRVALLSSPTSRRLLPLMQTRPLRSWTTARYLRPILRIPRLPLLLSTTTLLHVPGIYPISIPSTPFMAPWPTLSSIQPGAVAIIDILRCPV